MVSRAAVSGIYASGRFFDNEIVAIRNKDKLPHNKLILNLSGIEWAL
jgi:hypothetical protein